MALSHGALNELRTELDALRRHRGAIDARIQGIEIILSAERVGGAVAKTGPVGREEGIGVEAPERRVAAQGSLRKKVLEILQRVPGSKSAEVAQLLQQDGFRVGGVTSLRHRVSHEISRLRSEGSVRKDGGGLYVVESRVPQLSDTRRTEVSASL